MASVEIDQSGKVEDTAHQTIVAFANNRTGAISLSAQDKRWLLEVYRLLHKPKMFTLQVFAALVYFVLEKFQLELEFIVIDVEYYGNEDLIKNFILQLARRRHRKVAAEHIRFQTIGRRSNAHKVAIESFRRRKPAIGVSVEEVMSLLMLFEE